jgi:hypothetical protein
MYVIISVPATHDGIWNFITNLPSDNIVKLTVFIHDQFASKCSHSTDFHTTFIQVIRTVLLLRIFSYFADITCASTTPPPETGLILQYHTKYCRIRSTARYKKHFQILYSEFWSIMKLSVKKYNNLFWHLSVVTVGEYWRFLWSTAVCYVNK